MCEKAPDPIDERGDGDVRGVGFDNRALELYEYVPAKGTKSREYHVGPFFPSLFHSTTPDERLVLCGSF